ncbi:hypothetical protein Hypma_016275 [Hypsizygus marmoreus]|uniref:Uncharacterized protein n=1 Tax=Hypsizygus marmoreus TaxID=39966 RepID=A0A369J5A6_HYPMA|nr:hypothetical protein Hypma_016275 [Hypsizygus marmoreus]
MSNTNDSNQSTTSFQSTTTATSTSPLTNAKPPQKDYSAALATLQSRYGTGGHIPSPKPNASSKLGTPSSTSSDSTLTPSVTSVTPSSPGESSDATKKKKGLISTLKDKLKNN